MTMSQSLMVADGALKLDDASVMYVDPGVHIDETSFDSLTTVVACHTQGLGWFISQRYYG